MKTRTRFVLLVLPALLVAACADPPTVSAPDGAFLEAPSDALFLGGPGAGPAGLLQNFVAPHSGDQEVPANDSRARGQAVFQLSKDGTTLRYRLIVANIENVTQAHIHCGAPGTNGPVVAWLYPPAPPAELIPGRTNGPLAHGAITEADVIERPDSPTCPGGVASLSELIEKMRTGGAYSNVHTSQFPPGEIRGDIHAGGRHH
jgi:hypothetical protein